MAEDATKADAVIVPKAAWKKLFEGVTDPHYKARRLRREFAPVMGGDPEKAVFTSIRQPNEDAFCFLGPPEKADGVQVTLKFPTGHPMAGRPRYTWSDRGDGVLLGTLVPDPFAEEK